MVCFLKYFFPYSFVAFDYDDPYNYIKTISYLYIFSPLGFPVLSLFLSFLYWISLLTTF